METTLSSASAHRRKASEWAVQQRAGFGTRDRSDSLLCGRGVSAVPMRDSQGHRYSVIASAGGSITNPFVDISTQCMQVVGSSNHRLSKLLTSRDTADSDNKQHHSQRVTATPSPFAGDRPATGQITAEEGLAFLPDVNMNGPAQPPADLELGGGGNHSFESRKTSWIPTLNNRVSSLSRKRGSTIFVSPKQRLIWLRERRIKSSMDKCSRRLGLRNKLYRQRSLFCDASAGVAFFGIAVMVIDNELTAVSHLAKASFVSKLLRQIVLVSTVLLDALLLCYHATEVKLVMIDSGTDDWRVALSLQRVMQVVLELTVCSICPLPWTKDLRIWYVFPERAPDERLAPSTVPTDVFLSIPMLLRSYLVARVMVVHSHIFKDTATRTIAALNRISVDFKFVVKTMMTEQPIMVIVVFTLSLWIALCWVLTQCERYNPHILPANATSDLIAIRSGQVYLDSLWLIVITFMSIGYGDVIPHTACGRAVSICSGIIGVGVASALVAVVAKKLELTKAEKHVNVFLAETKVLQRRKNAAAVVLQQTWFIHRTRKQTPNEDIRLRYHQRKFLQAITDFRRAKWDQRRTSEANSQLIDVVALQQELQEMARAMLHNQTVILEQLAEMHTKVDSINSHSHTPRFRRLSSVDSMRRFRGASQLGTGGLSPNGVLWEQYPRSSFEDDDNV